MSDIVDLYRKHKDLLSIYFKSEEEAANCERRAEMGDDRAMRVMSLAYSTKRINKYKYVGGAGDEYDGPWEVREGAPNWHNFKTRDHKEGTELLPIDKMARDQHDVKAKKLANFEAAEYADSVTLGNRTILTKYPEDHSESMSGLTAKNFRPIGSLRYELSRPNTLEVSYNTNISEKTHKGSNSTILYKDRMYTHGNEAAWKQDRMPATSGKHSDYSLMNVDALKVCATAGSAQSARLLESIYSQQTFYDLPTEINLFGKIKGYKANPLYNSVTAKHWQRVAENLEGKTTPIEREKFLSEFLYSQDKTPEGLYNIGYALYHNEHIGNKERGLDYLKHAANLGDANAARELGEIYQDKFDLNQFAGDIIQSHFWYKIAATTPMKVTDSDGKVTEYDGHPNGKARAAYLEKAYPYVSTSTTDEKTLRNPSPAHMKQYPASAWFVGIPAINIGDLINDPRNGLLTERMEKAVEAIDGNVAEFENTSSIVQARLDEIVARQMVLDGRVEHMKGSEIAALRGNDALSAEQRKSQRAINLTQDRWVKETAGNLCATIILGVGAATIIGTAGAAAPAVAGLGGAASAHGHDQLLRATIGSISRASGYHGVMKNEVAYQQAIIDELESRKIDTSKMPDEINALAKSVQELADSAPIKQMFKDENRARTLVEGYLRQRILKSGLENTRSLNDYAQNNGLASVDTMLAEFEKGDARLFTALTNLCHGNANSNDMSVILADTNALKGSDLAPHEKTLKQFVERVVKNNIAHFMTRASQIDVIEDLKLVKFDTMEVDSSRSTADLVHGMKDQSAEAMASRQVDTATKLALTTMFSSQFGVTHIGQYDVTRIFNFYLHRHGSNELIASELHDGEVSDTQADKALNTLSPKQMRGYVERTKASAMRNREDQPNVGDLFMRVCGYEYYLPQAVITSGRGNRFKENPEAPVAYPMVNNVVQSFIQKLSLTDTDTYRSKVGEELDNIIAQTFIDFFQEVGRDHTVKYAKERDYLRDAYAHDNYGPRFDTYEDKITNDVMARFPEFLKLYEHNLKKDLEILPEADANVLKQQIQSLHADAKKYLSPNIPDAGSFEAREAARKLDHRGENMTERHYFG